MIIDLVALTAYRSYDPPALACFGGSEIRGPNSTVADISWIEGWGICSGRATPWCQASIFRSSAFSTPNSLRAAGLDLTRETYFAALAASEISRCPSFATATRCFKCQVGPSAGFAEEWSTVEGHSSVGCPVQMHLLQAFFVQAASRHS